MGDENTIFNLYHRVHKELIEAISLMAGPYEFNRGDLPVLARLVKGGDGVTQKEILEDLPISKSTMSKIINNMSQKGYLRKEKDPEDRRATLIYLTEKGKKTEKAIREIDTRVEKIMLKGFSKEEKERLSGYLERLLENLESI
ncbi:MAG: MarR family winged helix-turn-helix transcriptional regulator [Candidatus Hadarchaeia archaeon]